MKKLYFTLGLLSIISGAALAIRYDLKTDSTITDVANPKFTGAVQFSTMTAPGTPAAGKAKLYVKPDNKIYFKNSAGNEYNLTASGSGGASNLAVKLNGVQISSPTASLNFAGYFTAVESPAGQSNVYIDTTTLATTLDILTQASAAGVYLTLSSATLTYLPKAGTAADSAKLGGQAANYYISGSSVSANYLKAVVQDPAPRLGGSLNANEYGILNVSSITHRSGFASKFYVENRDLDQDIEFWGNDGGVPTKIMSLYVSAGALNGIVKATNGTLSTITDNSANWDAAYGWGDPSLTYIAKSSATTTYVNKAGKAADSDLLDGNDSAYFLSGSSATSTYLNKIGKAADSNLLDGNDSAYFLAGSSAVATYWQTRNWEQYFSKIAGRVQNSTNTYTVGYSSASKFYGNGSSLTGIISGVNLQEDGVTKKATSADINFTSYINVSTAGEVKVDSSTLNSVVRTSPLYAVVIGTYTGNGINYVCDGTSDEVQFTEAFAACPTGGTVLIMSSTYYFTNVSSITKTGITVYSNGATLRHTDRGFTNAGVYFYVNAQQVTFDGLVFHGQGFTNSFRWIRLDTNADYWKITNCKFLYQVNKANSMIIGAEAGSDFGQMSHSTFISCNGTYALINYSSKCTYSDVSLYGSAAQIDIRGSYNTITTLFSSGAGDTQISLSGGNHHAVLNSIIIDSSYGYGVYSGTDGNRIENNTFYNMGNTTVNGTIFLESTADSNVITGNVFNTIGVTGDNDDAIKCAGTNNTISHNTFQGNIDRYCIELTGVSRNNIVEGNNMVGATGQIGYIFNNGLGNKAANNLPAQSNFEVRIASSAFRGMPFLTPVSSGTMVITPNYELWLSTAAVANSWDKIAYTGRWEDLRVSLTSTKQGSGSLPDYDFTNVGYLFPAADEAEILYGTTQLPHSYKAGSEIAPHVHFYQKSSSSPTFKISYLWTNIGVSSATAFTTIKTNALQSTYTSGTIHQVAEFPDITGTGKTISSIFQFKLYREASGVAADVLTTDFDIHYFKDDTGSRQEFIK
jgi:hypothetical protein